MTDVGERIFLLWREFAWLSINFALFGARATRTLGTLAVGMDSEQTVAQEDKRFEEGH